MVVGMLTIVLMLALWGLRFAMGILTLRGAGGMRRRADLVCWRPTLWRRRSGTALGTFDRALRIGRRRDVRPRAARRLGASLA